MIFLSIIYLCRFLGTKKSCSIVIYVSTLGTVERIRALRSLRQTSSIQSQVAQWEGGEQNATIKTLMRIAEATGTRLKISWEKPYFDY